jgi:formylglycine-generating enzyme required for sulfatase activity
MADMDWATPTDYHYAIQDPAAALADEELRGGQVARNPRGLPLLWSGDFASVYRIYCPATGRTWALKCFHREVPARQERYRRIAECLAAARLPFTVPFVYLPYGIQVGGRWFPAVKMEWVEGQTLNRFVEESLETPTVLRQLLELWPTLAGWLRQAGIAHGDLQHGNVLLTPLPDGSLALKLIDYDGMYVPSLAGTDSGETGHPNYQHPRRLRQGVCNADVDRFSHLAIYCAVQCLLTGRRELWQRFNNEENLLFREADFQQPEESELFQTLWELDDFDARTMVGHLTLACRRPLEAAPWLDQIISGGRARLLTRAEYEAVSALMAAGRALARLNVPLSAGAALRMPPLPPAPPESPGLVDARPGPAAGTAPAAPRLAARVGGVGKSLLGLPVAALGAVDRVFGRLVGEGHDFLRLFLWVAIPALLFMGGWLAAGPRWRQPRPVAEKPAAAAKEPAVPNEEPKPAETEPPAVNQEPKPTDQRPTAIHEEPKPTENKPAVPQELKPTQKKPLETRPAEKPATNPIPPTRRNLPEIVLDLGGAKLVLVPIPAGEFQMGSPDSDPNAASHEKPQHLVRITRPFYLGRYPVTQAQWEAVMGDNPSQFQGPGQPVARVGWEDCQEFLAKLNARFAAGREKFQLPTEAQWEYACRAGSTTTWCYGDNETLLGDYAWYSANSGRTTHRVGEKNPNAWGLYDMHGNVQEWCQDWFDARYYADSPMDDPPGPARGSFHVFRGGGWSSPAKGCRAAGRSGGPGRPAFTGLRVCRVSQE